MQTRKNEVYESFNIYKSDGIWVVFIGYKI